MTANEQNILEHLVDQVQRGLLTPDQANVQKVQFERVLVAPHLTADVRRALNAAVKRKELAHMKKSGMYPEIYYHPAFSDMANEARAEYAAQRVRALKAVCT